MDKLGKTSGKNRWEIEEVKGTHEEVVKGENKYQAKPNSGKHYQTVR